MVTGGTCKLLYNVRKNNLINCIYNFFQKEDFIYTGFCAGAMFLTPSLGLAKIEPFSTEKNQIGINDFSALNIIDYEIFPHYTIEHEPLLEQYRSICDSQVIPLSDNDFIVKYLWSKGSKQHITANTLVPFNSTQIAGF